MAMKKGLHECSPFFCLALTSQQKSESRLLDTPPLYRSHGRHIATSLVPEGMAHWRQVQC